MPHGNLDAPHAMLLGASNRYHDSLLWYVPWGLPWNSPWGPIFPWEVLPSAMRRYQSSTRKLPEDTQYITESLSRDFLNRMGPHRKSHGETMHPEVPLHGKSPWNATRSTMNSMGNSMGKQLIHRKYCFKRLKVLWYARCTPWGISFDVCMLNRLNAPWAVQTIKYTPPKAIIGNTTARCYRRFSLCRLH